MTCRSAINGVFLELRAREAAARLGESPPAEAPEGTISRIRRLFGARPNVTDGPLPRVTPAKTERDA